MNADGYSFYLENRSVEESLTELKLLAETAGVEVLEQFVQSLDRPHASTFIGTGKAKEIAEKLFLSEKTVKHYVTMVMQKVGARHRVEVALMAARNPGRR